MGTTIRPEFPFNKGSIAKPMQFTTVTIARTVNIFMDYKSIICDANNLYEAYLKSTQPSKWKESTQKFSLNYLRHIFTLQDELESMSYRPGTEGGFTLCDRGKTRPITTLQPRDRVVRHVLCDNVLMPEVQKKLIYDNGSSIKGKGLSFANKRFKAHLRKYYMANGTNEGYILFGDFRKFYDNIRHDVAKDQLLSLFDHDEYLTWLIDTIFENFRIDVSYMSDEEFTNCMTEVFDRLQYRREVPNSCLTGEKYMDKSVNIGDQISQIIGVFYPHRMDNYIKTVRGQKYYGRYMDDWYLISNSKEELMDIYDHVKVIADNLGININDKKTRIVRLSDTYTYLQVRYSLTETGKIIERINPKSVKRIRRRLSRLSKKVQNGEVSYENAENMFKSWMGSFYKLMSRQTRQNLLTLFEELYSKRVSVVAGKLVIEDKLKPEEVTI